MGKANYYHQLKKKWTRRHQDLQKKLWENHGDSLHLLAQFPKEAALVSMSGLMLLTSPVSTHLAPLGQVEAQVSELKVPADWTFFMSDLHKLVPQDVRPLNPEEEQRIGEILSKNFGFRVTAELDGIRLNRSYGLIGQEQHLARYPGDSMLTHFNTPVEAAQFGPKGMAPGLGAWGYFARSQSEMTQKDIEREKYYIAVQTFLAPGFAENTGKYIRFFKFRKMLLVNPENGKAIVTVIGDAGPGEFTGKHLGGSPEVMQYLERVDGAAKGPVLYFFIDDPGDAVPLGPVSVK